MPRRFRLTAREIYGKPFVKNASEHAIVQKVPDKLDLAEDLIFFRIFIINIKALYFRALGR